MEDNAYLPLYGVKDVARYLGIPPQTLSRWCRGDRALIRRPSPKRPELSFTNLVEAFLLRALDRMPQGTAPALETLRQDFAHAHPLALGRFGAEGVPRFSCALYPSSPSLQMALAPKLMEHLEQVRYDQGVADRLFPVLGERVVYMDPSIRFGRPVVAGVPTGAIADRYRAGESRGEIADDFAIQEEHVAVALRFEGVG